MSASLCPPIQDAAPCALRDVDVYARHSAQYYLVITITVTAHLRYYVYVLSAMARCYAPMRALFMIALRRDMMLICAMRVCFDMRHDMLPARCHDAAAKICR